MSLSYSSAALSMNPVGLWLLNNTASDISGYRNNGTGANVTATTNQLAQLNGAYSFNGTSSDIDVPTSTSLNPPTAISVSAWFYPTYNSSYQVIVAKVNSAFTQGWEIANSSGAFRVTARPNSLNITAGVITLNTWQMISFTYDGTNLTLYGNTQLVGSTTGTSTLGSTTDMFIGCRISSGTNPFSGNICNVALYNYALTQNQITNLYNSGLATIGRQLIP